MNHFCTLNRAKYFVKSYSDYIQLIEEYQPKTITQHAIKTYAIEGNLIRTAAKLNELNFLIDNHPIKPSDISKLILSKPPSDDLLHKIIRRLYKKRYSHLTK